MYGQTMGLLFYLMKIFIYSFLESFRDRIGDAIIEM